MCDPFACVVIEVGDKRVLSSMYCHARPVPILLLQVAFFDAGCLVSAVIDLGATHAAW